MAWTIEVDFGAGDIDITALRLDPEEDGPDDDGLQMITVVVSHFRPNEEVAVITLEGYKVDR